VASSVIRSGTPDRIIICGICTGFWNRQHIRKSKGSGLDATKLLPGGGNIPSLLYCAWNECGFVSIGPALVNYFRECLDRVINLPVRWLRSNNLKPTVANSENEAASFNKQTLSDADERTRQRPRNISCGKNRLEPHVYLSLASCSFPAFLAHPLASLVAELLVESETCQRQRLCTSTLTRLSMSWSSLSHLLAPLLMTAAVGTLNVTVSWVIGMLWSNTFTIL
jgi:hypothetical protein